MPEIYIKCPKTGLNLRTGFVVDNLESNIFSNNSLSQSQYLHFSTEETLVRTIFF